MGPFSAVVDLLAPDRCLACRARGRAPWCPPCRRAATELEVLAHCDRCALPSAASGERGLYEEHGCWPLSLAVLATAAAYRYTGLVARTIATAKAREVRGAWWGLGQLLAEAVSRSHIGRFDVVTWVPSDPLARRRRGFDHGHLLAASVAAACGRPTAGLLEARGRRRDQARLPLEQRRRLSSAVLRSRGDLAGVRVLLVDDVLTTGATLRVAVSALTAAGSEPVRLGVLARAGVHRLDQWSDPGEVGRRGPF